MSHISITQSLTTIDFEMGYSQNPKVIWPHRKHVIPRFKMNDHILAQSVQMRQDEVSEAFEFFIVNQYFGIEVLTQLAFCSRVLYQRVCNIFKKQQHFSYDVSQSGQILVKRALDCPWGMNRLKLRLAELPKFEGLNFAAIRQLYAPNHHLSDYNGSDAFYRSGVDVIMSSMGLSESPLLNEIDPEIISRFPNLKSLLVQIENSQTLFSINRNFDSLPFLTTLILGSQTCPNYFGAAYKNYFDTHVVGEQKGAYPALLQKCLQKMPNLQNLIFADDQMLPFSLEYLPENCWPYLDHLNIVSAHASPQLIQQLLKAAPGVKSIFIQSRHENPIYVAEIFLNLPADALPSLEKVTIERLGIEGKSVPIKKTNPIRMIAPKLKKIDYIPFLVKSGH